MLVCGGQDSFQLLIFLSLLILCMESADGFSYLDLPTSLATWVVQSTGFKWCKRTEWVPVSRACEVDNTNHHRYLPIPKPVTCSTLTSSNCRLPVCNHIIFSFTFTYTEWIHERLLEEGLWSYRRNWWSPKKTQLITSQVCQRFHNY